MKCSASPGGRPRRRSGKPIESWRASITRTSTATTRAPKRNSRRSTKPTKCSPTPKNANDTTSWGRTGKPEANSRRLPVRSAQARATAIFGHVRRRAGGRRVQRFLRELVWRARRPAAKEPLAGAARTSRPRSSSPSKRPITAARAASASRERRLARNAAGPAGRTRRFAPDATAPASCRVHEPST